MVIEVRSGVFIQFLLVILVFCLCSILVQILDGIRRAEDAIEELATILPTVPEKEPTE